MPIVLKHQTSQDFLNRLRLAYRDGEPERVIQIAKVIRRRLTTGDLTDTQLRAIFGLTVPQWNTLKTKMQTLVNADAAVRSAVGE